MNLSKTRENQIVKSIPASNSEKYIRGAELRERLGGISSTSLWRLVKNGKIAKPKKLHGRNYWLDDVAPIFDDETHGDFS